jgi:hypothetical protein
MKLGEMKQVGSTVQMSEIPHCELQVWYSRASGCETHQDIATEVALRLNAHDDLVAALRDMLSGWQYIRRMHGDMSGVGWDRCESSARSALAQLEGKLVCRER